jgi:NitT/TauT family transport system substrate-binding protein
MSVSRIICIVLISIFLTVIAACVRTPATTNAAPVNSSTPSSTTTVSAAKLPVIRLVGTIGPLSIPLAYMQQNNSLASISEKTDLAIWATPTQLQAIITGGQGDFISLPTNSAATFYNKGVELKLMDSSIWNILYLITADTSIKSVTDLKGKKVVVPYQGAVPDAMFRFICQKQGVEPDIDIFYAPDPVQGSQLLLTGQEKFVLLSEPSATSVILKGQSSGNTFIRALNMQTEWKKATDGKSSTPVAGTVVLGNLKDRPDIVNTFNSEYQKAIRWMLANPVEAGNVGAKVLAEQGFTAAVLTESMKNIDWRYVSAANARTDLEAFFNALSQVTPNFIGGKLPDDGFYYR